MEMVKHIVTVRGEAVAAGRPRPEALGWVLRFIEPIVRESVSMGFRYTSRLPGRRPRWFQRASDIRFVDMSSEGPNGTRLHFEAPRFGEAAEDLYRQGQLFRGLRPAYTDTGFDLLGDAVQDVGGEERDSLRYDAGLLGAISRFYKATHQRGVDYVLLLGDRLPSESPVRIDDAVAQRAERMREITPLPHRARIVGKLDMIRDSDSVFELLIDKDLVVRGEWKPRDMTDLQKLFRSEVIMEGLAVYRASGSFLRLEAHAVRPAVPQDSFFRRLPVPVSKGALKHKALYPQSSASGANAIFGRWPGDESERELLASLEEG